MSYSLVSLVERAIAGTGLDSHHAGTLARAGGESHIRDGRVYLWQDDPVERTALVLDGRFLPVKHRMGGADITLPAAGRGEWICLCETMLRIRHSPIISRLPTPQFSRYLRGIWICSKTLRQHPDGSPAPLPAL